MVYVRVSQWPSLAPVWSSKELVEELVERMRPWKKEKETES